MCFLEFLIRKAAFHGHSLCARHCPESFMLIHLVNSQSNARRTHQNTTFIAGEKAAPLDASLALPPDVKHMTQQFHSKGVPRAKRTENAVLIHKLVHRPSQQHCSQQSKETIKGPSTEDVVYPHHGILSGNKKG